MTPRALRGVVAVAAIARRDDRRSRPQLRAASADAAAVSRAMQLAEAHRRRA